jgi:hypothetical protein
MNAVLQMCELETLGPSG